MKRMARVLLFAVAGAFVLVPTARAESNQLSVDQIQEVAREHSGEVRDCYVEHALKQKSASGKVTLDLVVRAEGDVQHVAVDAPGVRGHRFKRCVEKHVSAWQFPSARHGTEVQYPFLFHHTN